MFDSTVAPSATVAAPSSSSSSAVAADASKSLGSRKFSLFEFSTYVAAEARVEMLPRFSLPRISLISGSVGPFTTNYPIVVPLWLALYFRQTETCTLRPPAFLAKDYLEQLLQRECETETTFELLHFHFFEVAKLFFEYAQEDISDCSHVMRLVPEIQARRREKILRSISVFQDTTQSLHVPALKVSNLVSTELHFLRSSFCLVLNVVSDLEVRGAVDFGSAAPLGGGGTAQITPHRPSEGATTTIAATEASSAARSDIASTAGGAGGGAPSDDGAYGGVPTPEQAVMPQLKKRRTLRQR
jgi:GINS complex subunit 2